MLNVKRGKRKRQIQTTLDEIFKRQRPLTSSREGSSTMSTMTDVVEVYSSEENEVKAPGSNDNKQNQSGKLPEASIDEIEEFSSSESDDAQEASREPKNHEYEQTKDESLSEANHERKKVEEKSSETTVETIVIESSQESTPYSENIDVCSSDSNFEIPKKDREIPVIMVKLGTNNLVENDEELSEASGGKGISFVMNINTKDKDNLDLDDEETRRDIIWHVWLNLESKEVQERRKAKVKELEECLKEMTIEMKRKDKVQLSAEGTDTRTGDVNEMKSSKTSVEIFIREKDIKLIKAKMQGRNCEDPEESSDARVEMRNENRDTGETSRANVEIRGGDQDHLFQDGGKARNEDNRELPGARREIICVSDNDNEDRGEPRGNIEITVVSRVSMEFKFVADQDENKEGRETKSSRAEKDDKDKRRLSKGNDAEGEMSFKEDKERKNESDDETQNYELLLEEENHGENIEPVRLGVEFDTLLRAPGCCGPQQSLTPSQTHTILFRPYHPSQPYPRSYRDKWDHDHVRMPCSQQNKFPAQAEEKKLVSRWELICRAFNKPMATSYDLENAILSYHARNFNFKLLHILLLENITPEEHKEFIEFTLPGIIQMALALPQTCTQSIPFLSQQKEHIITMSQQQAACLLACGFLSVFPKRNPGGRRNRNDEFYNFPPMNFARLFQLDDSKRPSLKKMEKLKCILHYFKRVLQQPPHGTISFKRQVLKPDEAPKWNSSQTRLCRLRVSSDGTIEDDAPGLLQVDFANQMIGGGVLGEGCVQEEIRFAICPELIVSRLLTERLQDNECLIVTGAERFSDYAGYAASFQWAGNHVDQTPRDSWGRLHTEVVAIDAKPRIGYVAQFSPGHIKRELEKAFIGFLSRETAAEHLPAVATGKWGCGAFNGDPQLKSLIQIMAASAAHRDILYFTFQDKEHAQELYEIHFLLKDREITIGQLWQIIFKFQKKLSSEPPTSLDLFGYIRKELGRNDDG
ncbi:poly(ADP-ribose) glycohydrolase-like [Paramuricea clavata]|uniref:poly(ADP-ribose) glycohydrolase n=1 Tax=Paramuricea clavata TaxID=317549 RepID=A0A6S7FN61_PARCT|nr:poly(ADP-ribose) glycohydrolase-like [Paramuricea clavata]